MRKNDTFCKKQNIIILSVVDCLAFVGLIFQSFIIQIFMKLLPDCYFNKIGLVCPSCGGTRCIYNVFKGNFATAFHYNQFFFILFFYVLLVLILANLAYFAKFSFAQSLFLRLSNWKVIISIAFAWVGFGIIRICLILTGYIIF